MEWLAIFRPHQPRCDVRDYSKVASTFWTGDTGRTLRRNPDAQRLAMYVMTAPTANMIGLYYLPVPTICHDVGLKTEGALKALRSLSEGGVARYDEASGWVWVVEMARYQVGDELNEKDNRVKSIQKMVDASGNCPFVKDFCEKYGPCFHVTLPRGFKAPSEPLRSQEQEQEQEQKMEHKSFATSSLASDPSTADRSPSTFDRFWNAYPRRHGKRVGKSAAAALFAKLTADDAELAITAATSYAKSTQATEGFARDAQRFLKGDFWRDYLEPDVIETPSRVLTREEYGNYNPHTGLGVSP